MTDFFMHKVIDTKLHKYRYCQINGNFKAR